MNEYLQQKYAEEITNLLNDPNDSLHVSINVDLTNLQLDQPDLFTELLSSVHSECMKWDAALLAAQKLLLEGNAFLEPYYQIKEHCHVRFVRLPKATRFSALRASFPTNAHVGLFVEIKGNVVRMSQAKLLECRRVYVCGRCKQTVTVEAEYSKMYVIDSPRSCRNPAGQCKGIPHQRSAQPEASHCIDFQEIRLQELMSHKSMPASLLVTLENDLVDACQPGDCITVCGTIERRWKPCTAGKRSEVMLSMRAISVSREEKRTVVGRDLPEHLLCVRAEWQDSIDKYGEQHVRDEILQSFCPEVHGMYLVKLAVVLALSSGMNADCMSSQSSHSVRGNSHVILVGDPGLAKSKLLRFAARVATRAVHTTGMGCSVAGLTAAAVKEDGEWQLEAGALVLADGGVCCIDEFNLMREADKSAIHEAMEQQTISMAKAGLVCKLSTRCVILAATNPKRPHRNEEETATSINIGIAAPLLSRFDIVLILRDEHNAEWDERVADHLLSDVLLTSSQPPALLWTIDKLQTHFMAIRDINPILTPEASEILGCYYKSCRAHPARDPARTTVRLLDSIMRLAQAHARLMFRSEVTATDAVTVIRLMENSWGFGRLLDAEDILRTELPLGPTDQQVFEVRRLFDLVEDCDDHVGVSAIRQPSQPADGRREILRQIDDHNRSVNPTQMSQKRQKTQEYESVPIDSTQCMEHHSMEHHSMESTSPIQNNGEEDFDFDRYVFNKARMDRRISQKVVTQQPTVSAAPNTKWDAFSGEDNDNLQMAQSQRHFVTNGSSIGRLCLQNNVQQPTAGKSIGRLSLHTNSQQPYSATSEPTDITSSSNHRSSIGRLTLAKLSGDRWSQTAAVGRSYVSPLPPSDVNNTTDTVEANKAGSQQLPIDKSQQQKAFPMAASLPRPDFVVRSTSRPKPTSPAAKIQDTGQRPPMVYTTFFSAPPENNDDLDCLDDIDF